MDPMDPMMVASADASKSKSKSKRRVRLLQDEAAAALVQHEYVVSSAAGVREALASAAPESWSASTAALLGERIARAEEEAVRVCEERAVAVDGALALLESAEADAEAARGSQGGYGKRSNSNGGKGGKGGKAGRSHAARTAGIASLSLGASILRNDSVRLLKHAPALAGALGDTARLDAVLLCAVNENNPELVRATLLDPASRVPPELLERAVARGKSKALKALLADPRTIIADDTNAGGTTTMFTLLNVAAQHGRASAVTALIESGVPGLSSSAIARATHRALASGHVYVVRALLAAERFSFHDGLCAAIRCGSFRGVVGILRAPRFAAADIGALEVREFVASSSTNVLRAAAAVISDARFVVTAPEFEELMRGACSSVNWTVGVGCEYARDVVRALLSNASAKITLTNTFVLATTTYKQRSRWLYERCAHSLPLVLFELLDAGAQLLRDADIPLVDRRSALECMKHAIFVSGYYRLARSPCVACRRRIASRVRGLAAACGL